MPANQPASFLFALLSTTFCALGADFALCGETRSAELAKGLPRLQRKPGIAGERQNCKLRLRQKGGLAASSVFHGKIHFLDPAAIGWFLVKALEFGDVFETQQRRVMFPGASLTSLWAINDLNQAVGYYIDLAGAYHGFIYISGGLTKLDYPNSSFTIAYGLNNSLQIAGDRCSTVTAEIACLVILFFHALAVEALSAGASPPLRYLHVLPSRWVLADRVGKRPLRVHTGAGDFFNLEPSANLMSKPHRLWSPNQ